MPIPQTPSDDGDSSGPSLARLATGPAFDRLYDRLKRLASVRLRGDRAGEAVTPTTLVHEAYLRLSRGSEHNREWASDAHFFGAAAIAMRRILVERARLKRRPVGAIDGDRLAAPEALTSLGRGGVDMLAIDGALRDLAAHDSRRHDVVMLRYFAGLTIEETADLLGVSPPTVKRDWNYARAWLFARLRGEVAP